MIIYCLSRVAYTVSKVAAALPLYILYSVFLLWLLYFHYFHLWTLISFQKTTSFPFPAEVEAGSNLLFTLFTLFFTRIMQALVCFFKQTTIYHLYIPSHPLNAPLFLESFSTADLLSSGCSFVILHPRSYIPSFYSLFPSYSVKVL